MAAWRPNWFFVSGLCRWHGFRSITRVCFGTSVSNFMCMWFVAVGSSLLIFWRPYGTSCFPDSNFIMVLNIKSQREQLIAGVCIAGGYWFSKMSLWKRQTGSYIGLFGFRTLTLVWLWMSTHNFCSTLLVYTGRSLSIFSIVVFKMAAWWPYWIFHFWIHGMVSGASLQFAQISNFMCMSIVTVDFSDVTFKIATWWPCWIFWFPDSWI